MTLEFQTEKPVRNVLPASAMALRALTLLCTGAAWAAVGQRSLSLEIAPFPDHSLFGAAAGFFLGLEFLLAVFRWLAGDAAPTRLTAVYTLVGALLVLTLASGYLVLVTASPAPEFFGMGLTPLAPDAPFGRAFETAFGFAPGFLDTVPLGDAARMLHVGLAVALAVTAVAYFAWRVWALAAAMRLPADMLPATMDDGAVWPQAQLFAARLRFTGWLIFWIQLLICIGAGLMFQLAQTGRNITPFGDWYEEPIGWGGVALAFMAIAITLAYGYTRSARRITREPARYLDPRRFLALWMLSLGVIVCGLGVFASFTGVAMSVWRLMGKIVSQPPGIAITDPTNFIRMLDMLILISNIALLMGHGIGMGATQWMRINASRAGVDMLHALVARAQKAHAASEEAAEAHTAP